MIKAPRLGDSGAQGWPHACTTTNSASMRPSRARVRGRFAGVPWGREPRRPPPPTLRWRVQFMGKAPAAVEMRAWVA